MKSFRRGDIVLIGKVKNGAEPEHPKYETYAARPLAA